MAIGWWVKRYSQFSYRLLVCEKRMIPRRTSTQPRRDACRSTRGPGHSPQKSGPVKPQGVRFSGRSTHLQPCEAKVEIGARPPSACAHRIGACTCACALLQRRRACAEPHVGWAGDHTGNMYAALKMPTVRCNRPPTHRRTPFTRAGWGGRGRARYMEYAAWLVRVMVQHRPHMCGCATDKCPSIAANSACIGCLR